MASPPPTRVRVSPELHATLIDLCTGILPLYGIGVPARAFSCFAEALLRNENGQQPLPEQLEKRYQDCSSRMYHSWVDVETRPHAEPISMDAYLAFQRALDRLHLKTLPSLLVAVPTDFDWEEFQSPVCANPFAWLDIDGSEEAWRPDSLRIEFDRDRINDSQPICLQHCSDPQTLARVNRLREDGAWLREPDNFNKLLSTLQDEGAPMDDVFRVAAFVGSRLLGGGPDGYQHVYSFSHYCAPDGNNPAAEPYTVAERQINTEIGEILRKKAWKVEVLTETDAVGLMQELVRRRALTPDQATYMMSKLRYMARHPPREGVDYTAVPGVFTTAANFLGSDGSVLKAKGPLK
ncbi:uncharacterized protein PFL1_05479 [Pseudozyma flocculosa PF-1]|uniref:Uncharacterized protein n=1 Tax=Pseudozyma flocculosa PF-1 TaxID=1277687 RepID=A0A061H3E2_9BASI|nr:uncharacterized protein PFL1_05479 [Pseudozyma flocculosa PF-1]EPQ26844.1 hypothetical protein PFL1_05479 [Pseudozyma flocculosa PF-1]